jgi:hypothetical protein
MVGGNAWLGKTLQVSIVGSSVRLAFQGTVRQVPEDYENDPRAEMFSGLILRRLR